MLRQPNKRIGCDLCKRRVVPTYRYDRITDSYCLWICEGCERKLFTYEWDKKIEAMADFLTKVEQYKR